MEMDKISVTTFILLLTTTTIVVGTTPQNNTITEIRNTSHFYTQLNNQNNNTLTVAQFYTTWCPYCLTMKPEFRKIARENPNVKFLNVDADQQQDLVWRVGLRSVPTYKFFRGGRVVDTVTTYFPGVLRGVIGGLTSNSRG